MKVEVKEQEKKNEFPSLMKSKNSELIVLFSSEDIGIVLKKDTHNSRFDYRGDWIIDTFEDFKGIITLSND